MLKELKDVENAHNVAMQLKISYCKTSYTSWVSCRSWVFNTSQGFFGHLFQQKSAASWVKKSKQVGNANPGCIFQTQVYGYDGLQTRIPGGWPVITVG